MMLYTKYESSGPGSFRQDNFWKSHFENLSVIPVTYLCKPIITIWTILVEDYPGIIPVEFGENRINGSREEAVWSFPYIIIPVKLGQNPICGFRKEVV